MPTLAKIGICLIEDAFRWVLLLFRSTKSVQAENLFLHRQLALFLERGVRPRRVDSASRVSLAVLAKLFEWRSALVVVQPATMIRWHRAGWRLFWRFKSRPRTVQQFERSLR
jgi:putative transposase